MAQAHGRSRSGRAGDADMTVSNDDELAGLKRIGRIVADTLAVMGRAIEPGITTLELDAIGRKVLEDAGAQSAPELVYKFPGATCISVNEEVAHGIPGPRVIKVRRSGQS
jgi:methionyl aminopeptidase